MQDTFCDFVGSRSWSGLLCRSPGTVWDLSENEFMRNSSGNTQSQSSKPVKSLWTDPGLKSGINVHKLISTLKKAQVGNELSNILPKSSHARKKPPHFVPTDMAWSILQLPIKWSKIMKDVLFKHQKLKCFHLFQPTDQLVNWSINQWINQSINPPISQSQTG